MIVPTAWWHATCNLEAFTLGVGGQVGDAICAWWGWTGTMGVDGIGVGADWGG